MADGLTGKMMIVWGDADENVPPNQAYRLIEALTQANKPYDALILPNKTHPTASQSLNPYTAVRTWDYFVEPLMATTKPVAKPFQIVPRRVMQSRFEPQRCPMDDIQMNTPPLKSMTLEAGRTRTWP